MALAEFPRYNEKDSERYLKEGWWSGTALGNLVDRAADLYPRGVAVVDDRVRLTYSELRERIYRLAVGFLDLGIEKGDTILLQLPNWAEFVYSYFALQKVGAIPVLLITGYSQLEVHHLCRLTEARGWIVPASYRKMDYASFIEEAKEGNPQLEYVISVRSEEKMDSFTTSLERLMDRELSSEDERMLAGMRPDPMAVGHISPSGGTTGLPKGIPRTHNDYICNVKYLHEAGEMSPKDACLLVVPVGHNLALLNVVGALYVGYKLVLFDSTRPQDICAAIRDEKVTYMPTVPSLVRRMLKFEGMDKHDLSSIKKISAGGEPSSPELVKEVYKRFGCKYINEFGMTEGLLSRTKLDDDIETICTTVGTSCCPYDEVKIVDNEGNSLPPNTDGELTAKGPGIFAGYLKNSEENKKAFISNGSFKTGDLARINESGYIKITGRIKDIIIRGGENISPAQIEDLLRMHPGVADAGVIGVPDKELGEIVCGYIQPVTGAKPNPEQITSFMQEQGASKLLVPELFEFIDVLPMTQAGKIDKKALGEDIKRRLGQS